ncbi:hypothetical protein DPSP01_003202 [Paraphaeosphaeria sporulosa]|uniref:Lanthionine synthetase C-like protein n=1 Tax=Paraphaeosphaeria sporulosa TaxID=1460663 RepID=A0A177C3K5_9PLEO|nr:uncharacterized protein CC84DRAFT_1208599 [Paraphaeosphaeria sporulosa]OAG01462.1 hypothetical protein CC84DRAFT_1208599 [Paraphaeosphaeria sporulosa]
MDAAITFTPHEHTPLRKLQQTPRELLEESLANLVTSWPPEKASQVTRMGFYQGPTSIAYLFFHLSKSHSQLKIHGRTPSAWFQDYFDSAPAPDVDETSFGIASEYYCHLALEAAHTQDAAPFLHKVQTLQLNHVQEVLLGSAGLLVLLRFVKANVPSATDKIDDAIDTVITHINTSSWLFHGREFTGVVHGNIGIIAQVCLSGGASAMAGPLSTFLDLQQEDGNWHSTTDRKHEHMQWCHGVPGCVISLLAIKKYFLGEPLAGRIQAAIEKGQRLIFEKGIVKKEPCLCHGVTGNALALDTSERNHLLSFATPSAVAKGEWEASSDPAGLYCGEAGRAWVWSMLDGGRKGFPGYTDV